MNYRHAFHAGNFADCFKHALVVSLVEGLAVKSAPFFVLDTHSGAGRYDLTGERARRTGEAEQGIGRLLDRSPAALDRYLQLVRSLGLYPGSPLLIRALLRAQDRLVCCELHPEEVSSLRSEFHCDTQVAVHRRSGWEALVALLPPNEKRGLVLIDPPFENPDEFSVLADGLLRGHRRFGHGIFAAWYPIKRLASVRSFLSSMHTSAIADVVSIELHVREAVDPSHLNGCGLLVINPPYRFQERARVIAGAVLEGLGLDEPGAEIKFIRITDE